MSKKSKRKQPEKSQDRQKREARISAENPQEKTAARIDCKPALPEAQAEVPRRPDPQGVALTMLALRSAVEHVPFTFAVLSLDGEVEYLFGHESNPVEFLSAAEQLCGEGYILVGGALSQDFHDWTTFEFRFENDSYPPGFIHQVLEAALTLVLSDDGPVVH